MLIDRPILFLTAAAALAGTVSSLNAQYNSSNVSMHAQITVADFGTGADNGNDCWGYTSASGREYALMGLSNALGIVEITDPVNPVIVDTVSHTNSLWGDMKVYQDYVYVVNEEGGGMDIIDLSDVDNGNVTLVTRFTSGGLRRSHNVAINEASGYLYLPGSNLNGGRLTVYDLNSDPTNPTYLGVASTYYVHDAHIETYTSGPYAGREIAFSACGSDGLEIWDVTDKGNMFQLAHKTYSGLAYCHQLWTSEDNQYLFVDDELDEYYGYSSTTRTLVWDITDLSNPAHVTDFTSGLPSIDHNLYVKGQYVFESNYRSGLRIFDASDPFSAVEVGFFDTYPPNDGVGFDGAWSTFPYFASGTVIVSDMQRGLFILDPSDAVGGGGEEFLLAVSDLYAGQNATLTATGATVGVKVYFVYSLTGEGSTYVPQLDVTLDLENPKLAGSGVADGSGVASLIQNIPTAGQGRTVWMQAAEYGRKTNVVSKVIN